MEVGLVSFPSVMLFFLCKDVRKSGESLQVFRKCIARSFSVVIMMIIPADAEKPKDERIKSGKYIKVR